MTSSLSRKVRWGSVGTLASTSGGTSWRTPASSLSRTQIPRWIGSLPSFNDQAASQAGWVSRPARCSFGICSGCSIGQFQRCCFNAPVARQVVGFDVEQIAEAARSIRKREVRERVDPLFQCGLKFQDGFLRVLPRIVEPPLDFLGRVFLGHRPFLVAVDLFLRLGDLRCDVAGISDLGDPRIVDFLGVFVVARDGR